MFSTFRDLEGTNVSSDDDVVLDNRHASSIMISGDFILDHDVNWSSTSKVRTDEESQAGVGGPGSLSSRRRDSL